MGWDKTSKSGFGIENFLVDFLDDYYGWSFVAGNLNGKLVNKSYIEDVFDCKVIDAVSKVKGQKIVFSDGEEATMPDLLFSSKKGYNFWVESKSGENARFDSIDVTKELFEDYIKVKKRTRITLWVVFSKKNYNGTYNIYSVRLSDLDNLIKRNKIKEIRNENWNKDVYRFPVELFQPLGSEIVIN